MNIKKLRDELTNDPEGLGYSGQSDTDTAALINDANRNHRVSLNSRVLLAWSGGGGRLAKLRTAAANDQLPEAVRSAAEAALLLVTRPDTELDLSDSAQEGLVDGLVSAGVFLADDKTQLIAMATKQRSRADELGLGRPRPSDVQKARA